MVMYNRIRNQLLSEATASPSLISDLAGLESYIAESYDSRSFVELLQNTDDAGSSRFVISKVGEQLIVANDGRVFTESDFESLCRSAASSKSRGESIGFRGIGFKSVVAFAETIHILSGELEATFSRERTQRDIPAATRVPLIRIPHPLLDEDRRLFFDTIESLRAEGLKTFFVFDRLVAGGIEKEFAAFDPSSMLFLRNVRQVELRTDTESIITLRRKSISDRAREVRLASDSGYSDWLIVDRDGVSIAFHRNDGLAVPLQDETAVVHAFLPTHELTGLGVKIHGDVSTDPSRTRVVFDDHTAATVRKFSGLILELLEEAIRGDAGAIGPDMMAALMPRSDPRMLKLQRRSFATDLMRGLADLAEGRFDDLRLRPSWLNLVDYQSLCEASGFRYLPSRLDGIEGLPTLLRYFGAKELQLQEISEALNDVQLSVLGTAEILARIAFLTSTGQFSVKQMSMRWRLWSIGGQTLSFNDARKPNRPLDSSFVDLVTEKTATPSDLFRLAAALSDEKTAKTLVPVHNSSARAATSNRTNASSGTLSLKKWRSAEQQVLSLLSLQGWEVQDVSRQNVGYDLEARSPEGEIAYIEVKSIDSIGQPFILTSNEEAVAREKGSRYRIAIVRQTPTDLEVCFIIDPAQSLEFTRQCRQWVWECSAYDFSPDSYPLEDR